MQLAVSVTPSQALSSDDLLDLGEVDGRRGVDGMNLILNISSACIGTR
jgi:hypothetical protein